MIRHVELDSPAKLNLFLDVGKKRQDGYHNLTTVFEKISLTDTISLKSLQSDQIKIVSNSKNIPKNNNNIAYKAALILKNKFKIKSGVLINIDKRIPVAAGLGGGSSNAAATLRGLNILWKLGLTEKELILPAEKLGADVPFFIFNFPFALGKGRGDIISPIKSKMCIWHTLISFPINVNTKDIYDSYNLDLTAKTPSVKMFVRSIKENDLNWIKKSLYNSLEHIVNKRVAQIAQVKNFLFKNGFEGASVTGSGPTIFVLTNGRKEAEDLKIRIMKNFKRELKDGWKVFIAKTFTNNRQS